VIVFPDKYVLGWPENRHHVDDSRAVLAPAGEIMSESFPGDVHFVAYAADVPRRHTIALLQQDRFAELVPVVNLRMALAVFDVDGPGHKDNLPYTDEQWRDEQPKIAGLLQAHRGGYVYRTRGGYRLVYALPEPYALRRKSDDATWTALYKSWCKYLGRRFAIVADLSCADWTRLYRAPRVTRDGVQEERETIGDARALGSWAPEIAARDRVRPKRVDSAEYGAVQPEPISDPASPYGQARIKAAVRYLTAAPLSVKGEGGRTTMFSVCLVLIRRMRLPLELAADLLEQVYNPRLAAAGTSTWSREAPGEHGGCIMERLLKARDTGTVPIGEVISEGFWNEMNKIGCAS
jgi:hypothetical protein